MNAICYFDPRLFYVSGYVRFHQCNPDTHTLVKIHLEGFKRDTPHAIHIHTYGDMRDASIGACKAVCDHYNPHGTLHGSDVLYGKDRHVGDMINNIVPESGVVDIEYRDDLIQLFGKNSIVGRSVVVHEKEDDLGRYRTENSERGKGSATTGNAGGRIACSVIGLAR